jgi:hypothetical protein
VNNLTTKLDAPHGSQITGVINVFGTANGSAVEMVGPMSSLVWVRTICQLLSETVAPAPTNRSTHS